VRDRTQVCGQARASRRKQPTPSIPPEKPATQANFGGPSAGGPELAQGGREGTTTLAQRIIEMLIGRLITDERFRAEFLAAPERTLFDLADHGFDLSRTEIAALVNTDPSVWARAADALDPRLQKVSLTGEVRMS
jgi:hypothetical protein